MCNWGCWSRVVMFRRCTQWSLGRTRSRDCFPIFSMYTYNYYWSTDFYNVNNNKNNTILLLHEEVRQENVCSLESKVYILLQMEYFLNNIIIVNSYLRCFCKSFGQLDEFFGKTWNAVVIFEAVLIQFYNLYIITASYNR